MSTALLLFVIASVAIWLCSQVLIETARSFGSHTRLSSFITSLFLLGAVTSLPELAILIHSLGLHAPQIAVGTLVGSQFFILFGLIPLLAISSRGIRFQVESKKITLLFVLLMTSIPILFLADQMIQTSESIILFGVYVCFVVACLKYKQWTQHLFTRMSISSQQSLVWSGLKGICALGVLLLATHTAVRQLIELSALLQTPRFFLSMLLVPFSTNFAELTFVFGGLRKHTKEVVIADFLGSLACNSLLLAFLPFLWGEAVSLDHGIGILLVLSLSGSILFAVFAMSKAVLSVREGFLLLLIYILFCASVFGLDMQQRVSHFFPFSL